MACFDFYFIVSVVIAIFYEDIMEQFDLLPLPIAFGPPNRGKSWAAKFAVASCGNQKGVYTDITSAMATGSWCRNQFHLYNNYDDPNDSSLIKELLITVFGGSEVGTAHNVSHSQTTPIITANTFIIESLADDDDR